MDNRKLLGRLRVAGMCFGIFLIAGCSEQVNDFLRFDRFQAIKSAPTLAYSNASSDLIDTSNSTSFTINGTCSSEGKPVVITGAATATTTCTGGVWSANVDASAAADGMLTFAIDHVDATGNRATTVSVQFPKDTSASTFATFTKSDARLNEANTSTSFNVQLSAAKLYDTVLNYVVSGSALTGTDHSLTSGSVTIPAGQTSATVNFNVLNNGIVQNERRLAVSLSQTNRKPVLLGSSTDYFLDIADDDSGAYHTIVSYAQGISTMCLIFEDNKLKCWGSNSYGQVGDGTTTARTLPVAIDAATSYSQVIGGGGPSTCAMTLAGTVKCWGYNGGGQLGDGSTTQRTSPVLSNGGATFLSIYGGKGPHYCGVTTANKLRCWGYNDYGQIGDGSTSTRGSGVIVDGANDYVKASIGSGHSCGITSTGILKCWGDNTYGQLGDGTTTQRLLPVVVDAGTFYSDVSAGYSNTCAITTGGVLKCWGSNAVGENGDGTVTQRLLPVVVDAGVTYSMVRASRFSSGTQCGITSTGALKCWGSYYLLGDGSNVNSLSPKAIDVGTAYSSISLGADAACGLTTGGTLKCWGTNTYQIVQPYAAVTERLPVSPIPLNSYTEIARGAFHACGILNTGKLQCWGSNTAGQIGDGAKILRNSPVNIEIATNFSKVSAGYSHTCALTTAGNIKCWGDNSAGQLGDGTTTSRLTPTAISSTGIVYTAVVASDFSTCAITSTGILKCWGDNSSGQLGDGTTTNRTSPVTIDGGTTYKSVTISSSNACGVTTGKVLKCWGANAEAQVGDGTTTARLSPVVIDAGTAYAVASVSNYLPFQQTSCAVTDVGGLKCWGNNSSGQVGDGTTTNRTTPVVVDAGSSYASVNVSYGSNCATTTAGAVKCWGLNNYGQLGIGAAGSASTPTVVDAGVTYSSVSITRRTGCGLASGQLKCWGDATGGIMGRSDRLLTPTPMARILEP